MPTFPSTTFPADSDIQIFVQGAGLPIPPGYSFAGYGVKAQREWEHLTGRTPFIGGSSFAQTFDPPGSHPATLAYAAIYGGARVLPVRPGCIGNPVSVSIGGVMKILNSDYRMLPLNAAQRGRPYEMIEFFYPIYSAASSIVIEADWGFADSIDQDVWFDVLKLGGALVAQDLLEGIFASPSTHRTIDGEVLTQDSFRDLGQAWSAQAQRGAEFYKFKFVGV